MMERRRDKIFRAIAVVLLVLISAVGIAYDIWWKLAIVNALER